MYLPLFHHEIFTIRSCTVPPSDVLMFHHLCSTLLPLDVPLIQHQRFYLFATPCFTVSPSLFHCFTIFPPLFHNEMIYCSAVSFPLIHHQMLYCCTIRCLLFHHHLCSTVKPSDVALFHYQMCYCSTIRYSNVQT